MSRSIRIKNGRLYDPQRGVEGRVQDLHLFQGKICEKGRLDAPSWEIDATGMVVTPGAIDMHTHVVGPWIDRGDRTAEDGSTPLTPRESAERYALLGYTTVVEAAVSPAQVGRLRGEADKFPYIDLEYLLELGNHQELIHELDRHGDAGAHGLIERLFAASGALGIKLVNPGGLIGAADHDELGSLDEEIPGTRVSPRRFIAFMADAAAKLGLKTPLFLHAPRLGLPGNVRSTIDTLDAFGGRPVHLAHAHFYSYGIHADGGYTSAAEQLRAYIEAHDNVSADAGPILFGDTSVYSTDTALLNRLSNHLPSPGITLRYDPKDATNGVQWAAALELILRCQDPWRIAIALDYPNGGPFWDYPEAFRLLMDQGYRTTKLNGLHKDAVERTGLGTIDRELTLSQILIATRAGPAKRLGLKHKGHLGPGADGDVAIYPPTATDTETMCAKPLWVIKGGRVIVRDGRLVGSGESRGDG